MPPPLLAHPSPSVFAHVWRVCTRDELTLSAPLPLGAPPLVCTEWSPRRRHRDTTPRTALRRAGVVASGTLRAYHLPQRVELPRAEWHDAVNLPMRVAPRVMPWDSTPPPTAAAQTTQGKGEGGGEGEETKQQEPQQKEEEAERADQLEVEMQGGSSQGAHRVLADEQEVAWTLTSGAASRREAMAGARCVSPAWVQGTSVPVRKCRI
jgi:hypothetical protein